MEKKVGDIRKFNNDEKLYSIREILSDLTNVTLTMNWSTGVCPHCKHRLERSTTHSIYKIEVLGNKDIENNKLVETDIVILGDTLDGRKLMFPLDKYKEILEKTENFKSLEIKEV